MTTAEQLIENDLAELLGGATPPDLIERTLARIEAGETAEALVADKLPTPAEPTPKGRLLLFRRLATAACMLIAIGLITWVMWPRPLPETVTPTPDASYVVRDDYIQLKSGWLLLTDGAPEVRVDNGRVSDVQGRAVAGVGIPDETALDSLAEQFHFSATERDMLKLRKRWLTAGGLALCLFTGSVNLNGSTVQAKDLPKPEVKEEKIEIPAADDIEGVRKLVRGAVRVDVMVDGKMVVLDDLFDVRRITEALTAEGFATSDKHLGWDPWDGVTMYLADGRKITTSGLSWEEDVYDMRLPGMKGLQTYVTPGGAHDVLRPYFERARNSVVAEERRAFKVVREWTGADSEITERRCEIVTDNKAWSALWMEHTINPADDPVNPPKLPDVDFDKEMIVAVFGGSGWNSRGYHVVELLEGETTLTVRVDETTYQTVNGADKVTPYGIFVLPATRLQMVVEENVQSLKHESPTWKTIGEYVASESMDVVGQVWRPSFERTKAGGPGGHEFRAIYNIEQWNVAVSEIGVVDELMPMPDFGKSIGFVAFATRLKGLGDLKLTPVGFSDRKAVLRFEVPVAQSDGNPEYENICGLWLFPRPSRDVVVEEPILSMTEPPRWKETMTFSRKDEPFGVHYVKYMENIEKNQEGPFFAVANTAEETDALVEGLPNDFVDWDRESLVVVWVPSMRMNEGATASVTKENGKWTLTYHLTAPSGVDPGVKAATILIKVKKPDLPLVVRQSLKAGPGPAELTDAAPFKD
ncbi:MAG: hypothetical protein H6839_15130 [Planctomycetes bacterium]|nr:hypothetical protein [Planctomycetota bacterium]